AVDAVEAVDQAVRSVSFAVKRPVQKVAGLASGLTHGFAALRARRSFGDAVERGKEAARRREADLEEELRHVHKCRCRRQTKSHSRFRATASLTASLISCSAGSRFGSS